MLAYMAMMEEQYYSLFEEMYFEYRVSMQKAAENILNDCYLAEDAVSEAFIKVAQNIEKISGRSSQEKRNYLDIIVRNCAIDIYRKRQTDWDNLTDLEGLKDQLQGITVEEVVFSQESYQRLLDAITTLKEKYKDVMVLYYVYSHSTKEIAKLLNIKENTVSVRMSRGRKMLMEALGKEKARREG